MTAGCLLVIQTVDITLPTEYNLSIIVKRFLHYMKCCLVWHKDQLWDHKF